MDVAAELDDVADWVLEHRRLWAEPTFQTLEHLHHTIAAANAELHHNLVVRPPGDTFRLDTLELTSLGRKVGLDVPRWWVFIEAPNVVTFWNDTKLVFLSAQNLVRGAERFGRKSLASYANVIQELVGFLDKHATELCALAEYVRKLADENKFAPAVLFSGVVWGDTRRADRSLEHYADESRETQLVISGELAIGIRQRDEATLSRAWADLMEENADEWEGSDVAMPVAELLHYVHTLIRENLIEYFTALRDSIRLLDKLCQDYFNREHLHADYRFLGRLIHKVCSVPRPVESELWDVKEVLNFWRMPRAERRTGQIQFAEDVAAFANRRGGVLVVGVSDSRSITGVADVENRIKHLESIVRTETDAREDFMRIRAVDVDAGGRSVTCLLILAGRTMSPVGVQHQNGQYSYPLRVGPGIDRVSRDDIASEKRDNQEEPFAFLRELAAWV